MRRLVRLVLHGALWFGAWLLFVEKLSAAELAIGGACSLIAAFASEIAWGTHLTAFGGDLGALAQVRHLPWLIVKDTLAVFRILVRHVFTRHKAESLMVAVAFDPGAPDEPHDAARRALAIAYSTMTPATVVLGIDQQTGRMLYHQLERSELPRMTRNLGAQP